MLYNYDIYTNDILIIQGNQNTLKNLIKVLSKIMQFMTAKNKFDIHKQQFLRTGHKWFVNMYDFIIKQKHIFLTLSYTLRPL